MIVFCSFLFLSVRRTKIVNFIVYYFISAFFSLSPSLSLSFFIFLLLYLSSYGSSNPNELDSRFFVLPLTDFTLESPANIYSNLVLANPLDQSDLTTTTSIASTSTNVPKPNTILFQNENFASPQTVQTYSSQLSGGELYAATHSPMSNKTTSLTTPIKGIIPKLQRQESQGIPIPGRAQSHDDIRFIGSGYSSPGSNYGISPMSPRHMYGSSPIGFNGGNSSPPISCYGSPYLGTGNVTVARRALSRATSPLSSSVPTSTTNQYYKSSSGQSRNNISNNNSSRSDANPKNPC